MVEKASLVNLLGLFLFSALWSFGVLCKLLWRTIIKGPAKIFTSVRRDIRPEILDDPSLGHHGFARLKRLKLHYVANGSESKPLMLMVHGFPEFWYSWRHQLKEFGGDYRAVAMDMRGYGESDKPNGIINYTMDKLVADINELLEVLGHEKCILMAHDWGGAVAWAFAILYPDKVEKLIICNSPHPLAFRKVLHEERSQFFMSWYMFMFQMPFLPEMFLSTEDYQALKDTFTKKPMGAKPGSFSAEDMEAYKYSFSNGGFTGPINFYRASFQYQFPFKLPKEKLKVPAIIIWGTEDSALSSKMAELSGSYVEDCEVKYIKGASHWVQQEESEQVNKCIRQFLSK